VAEIVATVAMERGLGELSDAYDRRLTRGGRAAFAVGGTIVAAGGGRSRAAAVAGGLLLNAGAFLTRWGV